MDENEDFKSENQGLIRKFSYAVWGRLIIAHENKTEDTKIVALYSFRIDRLDNTSKARMSTTAETPVLHL